MKYDAVASLHTNRWTCGIAKFNAELATRLGVPLVGLALLPGCAQPLLSLGVNECDQETRDVLAAWLDSHPSYSVFLHHPGHDEGGRALNDRLARQARRAWAANTTLAHSIPGTAPAWCPQTIPVDFTPAPFRILSAGMLHKIQRGYYDRLDHLLVRTGQPYVLVFSTALHEGTPWSQDVEGFYAQFSTLREPVQFLGYLTDETLAAQLRQATAYAAFFEDEARENNTTVWAAMRAGCPVITNPARDSPFRHLVHVFDIRKLTHFPSEEARARVITRGRALADEFAWPTLVNLLQCPP